MHSTPRMQPRGLSQWAFISSTNDEINNLLHNQDTLCSVRKNFPKGPLELRQFSESFKLSCKLGSIQPSKEKSYTYLFFKSAINRFAADKLYKGKKKHIMPSLLNVQDNKDR